MSWRDALETNKNSNSTVTTKAELIALCERQKEQIQRLNSENETLQNQVKALTTLQEQLDGLDKLLATWAPIITAKTTENEELETELQALQNYVRGFTDGLHRFAEQAKQLIADKHLYQDVASRFKADMARKEQNRQAVIKQDLAKRTVPKLQKQQPNQTYHHNRGGLQR